MTHPCTTTRVRPSWSFLLLLLSLSTSCATARMYDGERRPEGEVAVVEGSSGYNLLTMLEVDIESVDGTPVEGFFTRDVELLPGPHELGVEAVATTGTYPYLLYTRDEGVVSLDAKAGGRYEILARPYFTGLDIFVVDLATSKIVGWREPELKQADVPAADVVPAGSWQLVIGGRKEQPRAEHFGWIPEGEPRGDWTEMAELAVITEEFPSDYMSELREDVENRDGKTVVIFENEPELVAFAGLQDTGTRIVRVTRPGQGCLYIFTYQQREGDYSMDVARSWADRFGRAPLLGWKPIE